MSKPFSKVFVTMLLDSAVGLQANTHIEDLVEEVDFDFGGYNLDPAYNRRAMYALAGKLAEAGYDVGVQSIGAPEPLYYEVVVEMPERLDVVERETWCSNMRKVWENVVEALGIEYVG